MLNRLDFEHKPVRAIVILTLLFTLVLSIIGLIFIPDKYIILSFLVGVSASLIGFLLSAYRTDLILQEKPSKPALITIIGFTLNYFIYGLSLYLSLKIESLNIFACLAGLLLIKITIYFKYGMIDMRNQNKKATKEGDMID
ncbi:MAG TPA: ATP synthase subunit I [Bacilli bacterium]|nr:ATP synthase subunit I [Bacilli bacterium]